MTLTWKIRSAVLVDVLQLVIFDCINLHCDLDLEDKIGSFGRYVTTSYILIV